MVNAIYFSFGRAYTVKFFSVVHIRDRTRPRAHIHTGGKDDFERMEYECGECVVLTMRANRESPMTCCAHARARARSLCPSPHYPTSTHQLLNKKPRIYANAYSSTILTLRCYCVSDACTNTTLVNLL